MFTWEPWQAKSSAWSSIIFTYFFVYHKTNDLAFVWIIKGTLLLCVFKYWKCSNVGLIYSSLQIAACKTDEQLVSLLCKDSMMDIRQMVGYPLILYSLVASRCPKDMGRLTRIWGIVFGLKEAQQSSYNAIFSATICSGFQREETMLPNTL